MSGAVSSRGVGRGMRLELPLIGLALFVLASCEIASAQVYGVPPLVTSIQYHVPQFLPNIRPSVTSLGPSPVGYRARSIPPPYGINRPIYNYGRRYGRGSYGYGAAYAVPYYVPAYDTSAGYDAGPYLYSGPPAEQTLHIVVDTAPARREIADDAEDSPAPAATTPKHEHDASPVDPTVLVFRDGHQQEVNNYAIMGQTLYVFDVRMQKIALGDLDVPATIKANDDRGVEFHLPNAKQS